MRGFADGGRDEVVRDGDGELLGNKRLGVFLGHVDAFAGGFAEKRLGELDKHRDGSRRSTNGVRIHIASRPSPGSPGPALRVAVAVGDALTA